MEKNGRMTPRELKIISGRLRAIDAKFKRLADAGMLEQIENLKKMVLELYYAAEVAQEPLNRMARIVHASRHDES
jgi:hypothetical protein